MKRKILFASVISIIVSLFCISYTYAANGFDNMVNGVRSFVGGTENAMENVGGAVRNGIDNMGNATENTTNGVAGAMTDDNNGNNGNNGNYDATRTATTRATDAGGATGGTYNNMWTWVIVGITAVGIGVLVWSYIAQNKRENSYIDTNNR